MNRHIEMLRVRMLIQNWIGLIRSSNYHDYYDINKIGEHLSRQLLNKIYGHQLVDLNEEKRNFPGLDLGDKSKDLVAFQVTSRTDLAKVTKNLSSIVASGYDKIFTGGIRFLILNDQGKIKAGPKVKKRPEEILVTFKMDIDIIYPDNLIKKIEDIYEKDADLLRFSSIKALLEKELNPFNSLNQNNDIESRFDDLIISFQNNIKKEQHLKVSQEYFQGNLKVPNILIACERKSLVLEIWLQIQKADVFWIHGAPATGKTSLAILLAKKADRNVYWIECRDVPVQQLIEHILNLLLNAIKKEAPSDYEETLALIFSNISNRALIILNDLTSLQAYFTTQRYLTDFITAASEKGVFILITSNHRFPNHVFDLFSLKISDTTVPPFNKTDIEEVLIFFGANKQIAELLSDILITSTEGNPLLLHLAARFLRDNGWKVDIDIIIKIFSGKFGGSGQSEIYSRLLEHTTDPSSRELLYRLQQVIGDISFETIRRISSIQKPISHTAEKINELSGTWLQKTGENTYQLSPLIKRLDGNLSNRSVKEINKELGKALVEVRTISQIDAAKAILYFVRSEEFNQAAIVLLKVLQEFLKKPKLFFDWGFNLYWFSTPFPTAIEPLFKTQIRVFQISICLRLKKDITFLVRDLQEIYKGEDVGILGQMMCEILFYEINLKKQPILAMLNLSKAQQASEEISKVIMQEEIGETFDPKLLDGIWLVFSQLHKKIEYEEWFNIFRTLKVPHSLIDPENNELYLMAANSIYRNAILKNKDSEESVFKILELLIEISEKYNLKLLSVYAIRNLLKYITDDFKDYNDIPLLLEKYSRFVNSSPLYKFLIFSEIASLYFYNGDMQKAHYFLSNIKDVKVPDIYTEKLDYLITYLSVSPFQEPQSSFALANEALKVVLSGKNYLIEDKIKLYGEVAITYTQKEKYEDALRFYAEGYSLLLDNFVENEEQQALIIRYGNAIKYLGELLELGETKSFGEGKNVIPNIGYFYRTNKELLAGKNYFAERKFMGATILQSCFETLGDLDGAKKWAYKCIEASSEAEKYLMVLQPNLHYLIQDRQYRQAYNIMAEIDKAHLRLKKSADEGEPIDDNIKQSLNKITEDDIGLYFFILLPIAFTFSLDVVKGNVRDEQFKGMIEDALNLGNYPIHDSASFDFAKSLFEQIIIDRISYKQIQELFNAYNGDKKNILFIISCILYSSFASPLEAAQLQLAIIIELETTTSKMKGLYRFFISPFFPVFWTQKFSRYASEFTGKVHLQEKGLPLIASSNWQQKIKTTFRVICNHLPINLSNNLMDYIGS